MKRMIKNITDELRRSLEEEASKITTIEEYERLEQEFKSKVYYVYKNPNAFFSNEDEYNKFLEEFKFIIYSVDVDEALDNALL